MLIRVTVLVRLEWIYLNYSDYVRSTCVRVRDPISPTAAYLIPFELKIPMHALHLSHLTVVYRSILAK